MDRKKHEILALCILTVTLLVFLSLISFDRADHTFFNASTVERAPSNWIGTIGAHLSWALLFLFGFGAYAIPFTGFWLSFALLRGFSPLPNGRIQAVGIVLFVLSLMGLVAYHKPETHILDQYFMTGGYVGELLVRAFVSKLYPTGAHVVLLGTLSVALLLATPFTLNAILGAIGRYTSSGCRGLLHCAAKIRIHAPSFRKVNDSPAPARTIRRQRQLPAPVDVLPALEIERTERKKPRKTAGNLPQSSTDGAYIRPSLDLLDPYSDQGFKPDWKKLEQDGAILEEKLSDFGVQGKVTAIAPGPVITMYEYAPAPGIKISRIVGLSDDLAMALKAISIRVVAPIPGKAAIGVEVPNTRRELVAIRAVLESEAFVMAPFPLTIALGKDITGHPVVANLAKMPHMLIAGATGTGKSVCINTVLSSLLYRNTPDDLRLLLIDPKRIELSSYEGIPHLIHPVVTDAKVATRALKWAVGEMELRYKLLADKNVRNIEGYNKAIAREKPAAPTPESGGEMADTLEITHHHLPYIVIIIDELADLMMVASREVEESITRLAQMARAAGIHLILATQRPSVDVLTGIIKANIPTRISFQVSSRIDSRTILDASGAESLLGSGDMLFLPPGTAKLQRIHGAFISDGEVERLTEFLKVQKPPEDPLCERVSFEETSQADSIPEEELDEKWEEAVQLVLETRQASISMLQRRLRVGYNRAARMIEIMEQQGIVGASDGIKPREVIGRKS